MKHLLYTYANHSAKIWACPYSGTGTIHPRTYRPRTIRPSTLFPDVFTSLYVSFLNESQPTELHQPWIGWAFSLT
jgi:hypothetical protein